MGNQTSALSALAFFGFVACGVYAAGVIRITIYQILEISLCFCQEGKPIIKSATYPDLSRKWSLLEKKSKTRKALKRNQIVTTPSTTLQMPS